MDNDLKYLMDEIRADQKPVKPKRKKKKRRRGGFLTLFLIVLLMVVIAGGALFWWIGRPERKLPGHWQRNVDFTASGRMYAREWLMAAEGGADYDPAAYIPELSVTVELVLGEDGTWSGRVDEDSYNEAVQKAYRGLEDSFEDLLITRVQASGREMESREEAAQSIAETIGMSCAEYLRTYGPKLLPDLEELQAQYNGSGSWSAEKGVLLRDGSGEAYLINTDLLVLSGTEGTEVYYRNAQ